MAQCIVSPEGKSICVCPEGTRGDPTSYEGCQKTECQSDRDCDIDKACFGSACRNPCEGACGLNTHCVVEQHRPVCSCIAEYTGNPYTKCYLIEDRTVVPYDPCSQRKKDYDCNPECLLNSDCPDNKSCMNRRCTDPCKDACGRNTVCTVKSHTAICRCKEGFYGDALIQCYQIPPDRDQTVDPCKTNPPPCAPNVKCFSYDGKIAICDNCASPDSYNNLECRPQCTTDSECSGKLACINSLCVDPCLNLCGTNSVCDVISHKPYCRCMENTYGNPYENCEHTPYHEPKVTCGDNICGPNAECSQKGKVFKCVCQKNFFGNALIGCHPECRINSDCPHDKACVRNRCENPCQDNICGSRATCEVKNHKAVCSCNPGLRGNPYESCTDQPDDTPLVVQNPCGPPTPCGPYSKCHISGKSLSSQT